MTEPDVASSDPTQLQTSAVLDGDHWVINGRKWFTSGANVAAYTTVMCRTETDVPAHDAFVDDHRADQHPGLQHRARRARDGRSTSGHCEVQYDNVRVPKTNLLGPRGAGLQDRAATGSGRGASSTACAGSARRSARST